MDTFMKVYFTLMFLAITYIILIIIPNKESLRIIETTDGVFIPQIIKTDAYEYCIGSDGFRWIVKYQDEYCIYESEQGAMAAIEAYKKPLKDHEPSYIIQRIIEVN